MSFEPETWTTCGTPSLDGIEIGYRDLVGEAYVLRCTGLLQRGVNDIGTNGLDLVADVTLSSQSDGNHQHDARTADNYPEHRKRRAQLIRAQRFDGQVRGFAPVHALCSRRHCKVPADFSPVDANANLSMIVLCTYNLTAL